MLSAFSDLTFLNPWLLVGLAALPAIWWLIRLTPPSPKILNFPAIQFLLQIQKKEESTDSIPWWLLILRLLIATLIIIGLAAPVFNLPEASRKNGPAVILVDNGWAGAKGWKSKQKTLQNLIQELSQAQRLIYIIPTAEKLGDERTALQALKPENVADLDLDIQPRSWNIERKNLEKYLPKFRKLEGVEFFWLSDGTITNSDKMSTNALLSEISDIGPLTIFREDTRVAQHVILRLEIRENSISVAVLKPKGALNDQGILIARAENGKLLFQKPYTFLPDENVTKVSVDLPNEIRNAIKQLEIKNSNNAAALFLLDDRWQRHEIGLVANETHTQGQSLLSETHYLEKALNPFYDIRKEDLSALIKSNVSLIALGDVATFSAKINTDLKQWISKGGVLIRFSGPKLANSLTDLTPVELRSGNRNLDGAMAWSTPASIGVMPKDSPFAKLKVDPNIKINKQVLANPSSILTSKTWAQLEDGTPLVTAQKRGDGWIVLFHTTATTKWSDLVLSGLFVEMLREIGHLGSVKNVETLSNRNFPPFNLLNGLGVFEGNISGSNALNISEQTLPAPNANHPAGYYGNSNYNIALNIGPSVETYEFLDFSSLPGVHKSYNIAPVIALQAPLLSAALLLILVDIFIALFMQGRIPKFSHLRHTNSVWLVFLSVFMGGVLLPNQSNAEENIQRLLDATLETRLAYVLTGNVTVDEMSKAGLAGLSRQLRRRTAIEADSPLSVNIETNELIFFPLIYWPVTTSFPIISDTAIGKINKYLKGGGTILFDTRDQYSANIFGGNLSGSSENKRLRAMLARLDIPNLSPVPVDHVLTRAFYLMQNFPGRYDEGDLWIENTSSSVGNDGVASVLIGGNDWAAAWATGRDGRPLAAVIPGGKRQREMAIRFGINLVMYTLAGNYKADQVHIPTILERLGQ